LNVTGGGDGGGSTICKKKRGEETRGLKSARGRDKTLGQGPKKLGELPGTCKKKYRDTRGTVGERKWWAPIHGKKGGT